MTLAVTRVVAVARDKTFNDASGPVTRFQMFQEFEVFIGKYHPLLGAFLCYTKIGSSRVVTT